MSFFFVTIWVAVCSNSHNVLKTSGKTYSSIFLHFKPKKHCYGKFDWFSNCYFCNFQRTLKSMSRFISTALWRKVHLALRTCCNLIPKTFRNYYWHSWICTGWATLPSQTPGFGDFKWQNATCVGTKLQTSLGERPGTGGTGQHWNKQWSINADAPMKELSVSPRNVKMSKFDWKLRWEQERKQVK